MSAALSIVVERDGVDDEHYAAIAQQRRRIRSLYRGARRALDTARIYLDEGESFTGPRVRDCLLSVRAYRLSIRSIRRSL